MAATIKHKYTSAVADGGDTSLVQPSNWNDTHDLTGTIPLANGGTNADLSATGPGFLKQASSGAAVTIALPTATDVGLGNVDNTSDVTKTATLVAAAHTWALTQTFTLAPVYTDAAGTRTALGLGTAAVQNTGTSGANVPLLSAANIWASGQVFVAPVLGTPASGVATNLTGLPISTGLTGAGTGVLTALGVNVGSAGAPVLFNGALGTPSSGTLTNATGLPAAGVTGLATVATSGSASDLGSGTLPNGRLVAIPNSALANSAITINGTSVSLGGSISKGWITLDRSHVQQTVVTGVAAKTTSYSFLVPGGTLNANGSLRVSFLWTFFGTVGTKQVGIDWGAFTFWSTNAFASASLGLNGQITIANRNSASSQIVRASQNAAFSFQNSTTANVTGAINTAADQTLTLWVVMNGALDTGAVHSVHVEYNND